LFALYLQKMHPFYAHGRRFSFADRFMPFTAFFPPFAVLLSTEPNIEITFVI